MKKKNPAAPKQVELLYGMDVFKGLKKIPSESVHCVVTSPPYWALRDYKARGQIGLEKTPQAFVKNLVSVFREVRRVLRNDGTFWLNIGDSYNAQAGQQNLTHSIATKRGGGVKCSTPKYRLKKKLLGSIKPKDLIGVPWRLALALQEDGWYLRSDIIWNKPNPMPSSATDRPTLSHEYIFLLTKSKKYFYDQDAIRTPLKESSVTRLSQDTLSMQIGSARGNGGMKKNGNMKAVYKALPDGQSNLRKKRARERGESWHDHENNEELGNRIGEKLSNAAGANIKSVWTFPTQGYAKAHFATFPQMLPLICIQAGTSPAGACSQCGSPRLRITEKRLVPTAKAAKTAVIDARDDEADENDAGSNRQKDGHMPGMATEVTTLGFKRNCKCKTDSVIPCTVLDPFSGSGTTGLVATSLGRRYIGIDINKSYLEMARERIGELFLI